MRAKWRAVEVKASNLDDPDYAAFAWARYWRLMRFMAAITVLALAGVITAIYMTGSELPIHFYIATGLGVFFSMLLASALMGLVFLSSGTGHDEAIDDRIDHDLDLLNQPKV